MLVSHLEMLPPGKSEDPIRDVDQRACTPCAARYGRWAEAAGPARRVRGGGGALEGDAAGALAIMRTSAAPPLLARRPHPRPACCIQALELVSMATSMPELIKACAAAAERDPMRPGVPSSWDEVKAKKGSSSCLVV